MRTSPKVFDPLYVNMVEAGETGGILDTILQRLSSYIEKNVKLQRAVKSALVYPVGVISVAGGVITLLLWKVVPIFATLFAGLGVDLPLPTKVVIGLSNFIGSIFGLLILVAIAAIVIGIKVWYGTEQGRYALDSLILKLPVLGILMQKIADFYEEEVDAAVKDLLTAMEPVMIVFLGVVVGGVVISMYMPLFSLIGKLSGK